MALPAADRDAPVAEQVGLELREDRVAARAGVDFLGQLGAHERAGRLLELRRVFPKHGPELREIDILAAGRDEGIDGSLVRSKVDFGMSARRAGFAERIAPAPGARSAGDAHSMDCSIGSANAPDLSTTTKYRDGSDLASLVETPMLMAMISGSMKMPIQNPFVLAFSANSRSAIRSVYLMLILAASAPTSATKASCRLGSE